MVRTLRTKTSPQSGFKAQSVTIMSISVEHRWSSASFELLVIRMSAKLKLRQIFRVKVREKSFPSTMSSVIDFRLSFFSNNAVDTILPYYTSDGLYWFKRPRKFVV